jgi:RNA polymerase sigma-70 factor, ECF subfamily
MLLPATRSCNVPRLLVVFKHILGGWSSGEGGLMVAHVATSVESDSRRQLLTQWFTDYNAAIFRYLVRLLGDEEQAADILQETFIRALTALDAKPPPLNPSAWLYRIATNLTVDTLRRRSRWRWFLAQQRETTASFDNDVVTAQSVRHCLAGLSPRDAETLMLVHYAGFSATEIATLTGEDASTIRVRVHRARTRFRTLYEKEKV